MKLGDGDVPTRALVSGDMKAPKVGHVTAFILGRAPRPPSALYLSYHSNFSTTRLSDLYIYSYKCTASSAIYQTAFNRPSKQSGHSAVEQR
jgi:hypothetical protein